MAVVELSATIQQDKPLDLEASRQRVRRALRQDTLRIMEKELQALKAKEQQSALLASTLLAEKSACQADANNPCRSM